MASHLELICWAHISFGTCSKEPSQFSRTCVHSLSKKQYEILSVSLLGFSGSTYQKWPYYNKCNIYLNIHVSNQLLLKYYNFGVLVSTSRLVFLSLWGLNDSGNISHKQNTCCVYHNTWYRSLVQGDVAVHKEQALSICVYCRIECHTRCTCISLS